MKKKKKRQTEIIRNSTLKTRKTEAHKGIDFVDSSAAFRNCEERFEEKRIKDTKFITIQYNVRSLREEEKMEAFMKKNDYHMVLPESAIKATGGRKIGDLTLGKGGAIQYNGEAFLLPVKAFRTVLTEITSDKFIKRQRVPKQMFSVLSEYGYSDIDPKVMKDMQDTLSLRATEGTPEGKQILERVQQAYSLSSEYSNISVHCDRITPLNIPA